jgi:lysophospholipase L1-like esterase
MVFSRTILFACFLFVLLCTCICEADPIIKKDDKIWLIGDSNGFLLMQELPKLAKANGYNLKGNPVGGSSVISWSFQLNKQLCEMNRFHPTIVLVCLGSNDAYMGPSIIKNEPIYLNMLLRKIIKQNRIVVWIGPIDLAKKRAGLEAFYQMVSPIPMIVYLDSRQIHIDMWDDLLHPSFVGRKVWAEWIWSQLIN